MGKRRGGKENIFDISKDIAWVGRDVRESLCNVEYIM